MADTNSIAQSYPPPASFECKEGNLVDAFKKHGNPIQLDIPTVKNINDVWADPAIKNALKTIGDHVIVNDTDLEKLAPKALRSELGVLIKDATYEKNGVTQENVLPRLKEIETEIYNNLENFDPTLAKAIHPYKISENEDKPFEHIVALNANLDTHLKLDDHTASIFTDTKTKESFTILKIPDQNTYENHKQSELEKIIGQPVKEMPGTSEQQTATIIIHEIEHALHNQNNIDAYFKKVEDTIDENNCNNMGFSLQNNVIHARELEASLSAVNALKANVPENVLQYDAAYYIAKFHGNHMIDADIRHPISVNTMIGNNQYMTIGFQMHDYIKTGEIPDYFESTTTINSFFAKTRTLYNETFETALKDNGLPSKEAVPHSGPTVPITLDLVQKALKTEPSPYTPAETQAAQTFIDAMQNDLGVKPQNVDATLKEAIDSYKKFRGIENNEDLQAQPLTPQ